MKRKIGLYLLPCSTVGRPIRACKDGMISAATATHELGLQITASPSKIGQLRRKRGRKCFRQSGRRARARARAPHAGAGGRSSRVRSVFEEVCPSLT